MQKSFAYVDRETFIHLFKTFIQPVLEYVNIIWGAIEYRIEGKIVLIIIAT